MGRNSVKTTGKGKRKKLMTKADDVSVTNSKKSKIDLTDQNAGKNSQGQRSLRSTKTQFKLLTAKPKPDNCISRAFKNVLRKENERSRWGKNNNATISNNECNKVTATQPNLDLPIHDSAIAGCSTQQQGSQNPQSCEADGIQVQVNESEDEFRTESDLDSDNSSDGLLSDDGSDLDDDDQQISKVQIPNESFVPGTLGTQQQQLLPAGEGSGTPNLGDPQVQQIVKMVREGLKDEIRRELAAEAKKNNSSKSRGKLPGIEPMQTPVQNNGRQTNRQTRLVHSPSDAPALRRDNGDTVQDELITRVSNFVDEMRIDDQKRRTSKSQAADACSTVRDLPTQVA